MAHSQSPTHAARVLAPGFNSIVVAIVFRCREQESECSCLCIVMCMRTGDTTGGVLTKYCKNICMSSHGVISTHHAASELRGSLNPT